MKRIYVAGPMSGVENGNRMAFNETSQQLRSVGWDVINPCEIYLQSPEIPDNAHRAHCLRDIASICLCDAIFTLPNWEKSIGASAEVACAKWLRIPILSEIKAP